MALVTVQRSPSVAGSPQCSNSDGEAEDDEGSKNERSECFFAGKGTALVLALKDIPQYAERRLSTDSTRSTNSTQSNNSDIQQHLQSMFNLLQHEETLKMAVKLESQRPNRTRYLVIVSRCCYRSATSERRSKIMRHNSAKQSATTSSHLLNTANAANIGGGSTGINNVASSGGVGGSSNGNNGSVSGGSGVSTQRQLSVDSHKAAAAQAAATSQHQQQTLTLQEDAQAMMTQSSHLSSSSSSTSPNLCRQSMKCDGDKENISAAGAGDSKSTMGIEESCLLGIDCNERTTIGLVVPILADTTIRLDGDGGFSVSVYGKTHILKPVSVQAMWSALQTLHKVSQKACENNFYPGGPSHDWLAYYDSHIESDQSCLNEWNAMDSLESRRPPSPDAIRNKPTAKEETESVIKMKLKEIMMSVDLDEVTSKYIRGRLEEILDMDLGEYKSFIDEEMLIILGQMDAPTEIFEHVYLGSEWNASNLEELQRNGVRHILNVTREIDNFFPGMFDYFNVRVYDDEKTNLLKHWDNTYRYITRAKAEGSKVLVHCKMGVSRSASVVIAYAMKAYNWEFQRALQHVKERRSCIKPNKNFLNQLETYSGMLDAMKNKEKLQRSKSETNLKSTKDARLLPGSEPTPLIQALNQAKSKSATSESGAAMGSGIVDDDTDSGRMMMMATSSRRSSAQKHRHIGRRSSSTSPKTQTAIVMKQQSQSLENLTPERSVAEEPKNMRFPGSNGENYSVTQNQVLHIQKHTPSTTSVRTRVHDLEVYRLFSGGGGCSRSRINLLPYEEQLQQQQTSASSSQQQQQHHHYQYHHHNNQLTNSLGSTVWTSSAKLITQTSNLGGSTASSRRDSTSSSDVFSTQVDHVFAKEEQQKPQRRKTHSWTESSGPSGGIILDTTTIMDGTNTTTILRSRTTRQRELPSRHASWGSGDNRCSLPLRNSSWNCYDTNRNATNTAIFEGQIHELKTSASMSNKTGNNTTQVGPPPTLQQQQQHTAGTVKRTKLKLEESTAQKKLCQENGQEEHVAMTIQNTIGAAPLTAMTTGGGSDITTKRNSNLFRSSSSVGGATRVQHPMRCNSEELVNNSATAMAAAASANGQMPPLVRRSDGSRPLPELYSASAPVSYTTSDIENKNTVAETSETTGTTMTTVVLRGQSAAPPTAEDQRISGNVQILKQSFEAKAVGVPILAGAGIGAVLTSVTLPTTTTINSSNVITTTCMSSSTSSSMTIKKSHQSLPSSPVAQHVDHQPQNRNIIETGATSTSNSSAPTATTAVAVMMLMTNPATATTSAASPLSSSCSSTSSSSSSSASSSSSSASAYSLSYSNCFAPSSNVSEATSCDRNVKGLVHKYQTTTPTISNSNNATNTMSNLNTTTQVAAAAASTTNPPVSLSTTHIPYATVETFSSGTSAVKSNATGGSTTITNTSNINSTNTNFKPRPRSYYDRSFSMKTHDYSDSRPPPAPARINATTNSNTTERQQQQQTQSSMVGVTTTAAAGNQPAQRRLAQHGKTHPLTRLSLPKQSFNAAAYNTM